MPFVVSRKSAETFVVALGKLLSSQLRAHTRKPRYLQRSKLPQVAIRIHIRPNTPKELMMLLILFAQQPAILLVKMLQLSR
eukprot:250061-Amphidinium_carterae.1